jgi:CheY-like chemotaxis protein
MLLDLSMPDLDGLTVLKQINSIKGDLQVIVLTANQDVNLPQRSSSGSSFQDPLKGILGADVISKAIPDEAYGFISSVLYTGT